MELYLYSLPPSYAFVLCTRTPLRSIHT